ncbi:hypothetical protein [Xenorhabdus bovienii]|uniref:hypothetical protein n=1 Tax=Xenorhabdus bovienii TaxID=40576 RepID=UPI0023B354AF|nr:hypothetical protein [Xenorhabdus bovienii]MDE9483690.1 OB-fold putative lipoprotein [Xenorhabdus bovienii]
MTKIFTALLLASLPVTAIAALPQPEHPEILKNVKEVVIQDAIDAFLNKGNGGAFAFRGAVIGPLTDMDIIREYKRNELAANNKFQGKPIRVLSKAINISADMFGNGVITTGSPFGGDHLSLRVDKNDPEVLNLVAGERIDMVCTGYKYVLDSPILKDCKTSKEYANETVKKMGEEINLISYILYFSAEKELAKHCKNDKQECLNSIPQIMSSDSTQEAMKVFLEKHKKDFAEKFNI